MSQESRAAQFLGGTLPKRWAANTASPPVPNNRLRNSRQMAQVEPGTTLASILLL
jgi:hypothetical protein